MTNTETVGTSREERMVVIERDETGKPTIWCDPEIADLVTALNAGGVPTIASCSGHGHSPCSIALKDGRWLVIAKDDAEHDQVEAIFPTDINGEMKGKTITASQLARFHAVAKEAVKSMPNGSTQEAVNDAAVMAALSDFASRTQSPAEWQVEWVVNDIAELGVKIGDQFFFCYKGGSLTYTGADGSSFAAHDNGKPMHWRPVFKREFGECVHPINYKDPTKIGAVSLDDSDEWQLLPAAPKVDTPLRLRAASIPAPERSKEEMGKALPDDDNALAQMVEDFHVGSVAFADDPDEFCHLIEFTPELLRAFVAALETPPLHKEGEVAPVAYIDPRVIALLRGTPAQKVYLTKTQTPAYSMPLYAAPVPVPMTITDGWPDGPFKFGDRVEKTKGSSWHGRVCGWYRTDLTPLGYNVESEREPGSVQLYPVTALEPGEQG